MSDTVKPFRLPAGRRPARLFRPHPSRRPEHRFRVADLEPYEDRVVPAALVEIVPQPDATNTDNGIFLHDEDGDGDLDACATFRLTQAGLDYLRANQNASIPVFLATYAFPLGIPEGYDEAELLATQRLFDFDVDQLNLGQGVVTVCAELPEGCAQADAGIGQVDAGLGGVIPRFPTGENLYGDRLLGAAVIHDGDIIATDLEDVVGLTHLCPPVDTSCRVTGGINLTTTATTATGSARVTVTGGFQLRGPDRGTSNMQLQVRGGLGLNIHMDKNLEFYSCDGQQQSATATAFATVNGVAGYFLRVTVDDNGEPGRNDTVSVELRAPDGSLVLQFSAATQNRGGNIQFHRR